MAWLCSFCGNINNDLAKLCDKCGEIHRISTGAPMQEAKIEEEKKECRDYASRFRRLIGFLLDIAVFVGIHYVLTKMQVSNDNIPLIIGITIILYYLILECLPMQGTLGKFIVGICVNNKFGEKISFIRSLARTFIKICLIVAGYYAQYMFGVVGILSLLVIYGSVFFTEKRQTLYDMISGTIIANRGL